MKFDPAILLGVDQIGGPVELPLTQPGRRETRLIGSPLNGFQPLQVLGLARIAPDVPVALALATIESVSVLGAFHASPAVKAALADRIH